MSFAAHHALLDRPRIRSHPEHFRVVIRFQDQQVRAAQVHFDRIGGIAEIRHDPDLHALSSKAKPHGIAGVVRYPAPIHPTVTDRTTPAPLTSLDHPSILY